MKKTISLFVFLLVLLPGVLGITGEIGNARAVITREWNGMETLERTILVKNSNDVKVNIKLEPSDEIKDIAELIDKEFELQPGEERKARYNLKIKEEGRWDGSIFVYFIPEDGSRVALASSIFLKVGNPPPESEETNEEDASEEETSEDDNEITGEIVAEEEEDDTDDGDLNFGIGGTNEENSKTRKILLISIIGIIIAAVIAGFIFLLRK